jgi:hypothetical protein
MYRFSISFHTFKAASHRAKKGDAGHHRRGTKWVHLTSSGKFSHPLLRWTHCSYL